MGGSQGRGAELMARVMRLGSQTRESCAASGSAASEWPNFDAEKVRQIVQTSA